MKVIRAFCLKCGCGNAERDDDMVRIPGIMENGYGVTKHRSCRGCLCHGRRKQKGMPGIELSEVESDMPDAFNFWHPSMPEFAL